MAASALLLAGSLAISAVGIGMQVSASREAAAASQRSIEAQKRAEAARFAGQEIDANRRRREMIRRSIIARSQALSNATARGAADSSALGGAFGQIAGLNAFNLSGVGLGQQIGSELFAANAQGLLAKQDEAGALGSAATGQGIASLGGAIGRNVGTISKTFAL